jgi:KDO2-lipid IV(A) lauroyltransferase
MLAYLLVRFVLAVKPSAAGKLLDVLVPRYRRIARENLLKAGYSDPEPIIDGVFRSIGRIFTSFAQFPQINRQNVHEWIHYDGLENFTGAMARGKGVLVARPLDNPHIDKFVEERRGLSGNPVIEKRDAARKIFKALHAGESVGILIDQNSSREEGVFIDFFGRKACANAAFVKFAHRTGAAVVPGFALWSESEKKYVLRFYPEIVMSGDVQRDTQAVHSVLENVIREYPDQWLWIHRRWKTQPE